MRGGEVICRRAEIDGMDEESLEQGMKMNVKFWDLLVPLAWRSGVDQQQAKWLEPEKTAMLMHRGRSCASQRKPVVDGGRGEKCLSIGAVSTSISAK
jgi:hypothetical protein